MEGYYRALPVYIPSVPNTGTPSKPDDYVNLSLWRIALFFVCENMQVIHQSRAIQPAGLSPAFFLPHSAYGAAGDQKLLSNLMFSWCTGQKLLVLPCDKDRRCKVSPEVGIHLSGRVKSPPASRFGGKINKKRYSGDREFVTSAAVKENNLDISSLKQTSKNKQNQINQQAKTHTLFQSFELHKM